MKYKTKQKERDMHNFGKGTCTYIVYGECEEVRKQNNMNKNEEKYIRKN